MSSGNFVDLSSDPPDSSNQGSTGRRFLGIHFACCDVYSRIYLNSDQTAYSGHCPRCSRAVHIRVGPGGTDNRFFTAF